ncbi:MAG: MBL fold metallo-hydrolase [Halobacteriaceae archaeon]
MDSGDAPRDPDATLGDAAPGDAWTVDDATDVHCIETGMYGVSGYGAVYLVAGAEPALVETGIGANTDAVLDAVVDLGVELADLAAVLVTHVHLDHAGGAGRVLERCPDATLAVHEAGAPHLVDPGALVDGTKRAVGEAWRHYGEPVPVPEDRVRPLAHGDRVPLGDRDLVAHACPGHAPHQVVFADTLDGSVFAGDAAGIWVPDREQVRETTPPPQFDLEAALADVETVRDLGPERLLFTHFGPGPDRVDRVLDRYRARLVGWVEAVRRARERLGDDAAVADHFAAEAVETVGSVWGERKARQEARLNVRGVLAYLDGRE